MIIFRSKSIEQKMQMDKTCQFLMKKVYLLISHTTSKANRQVVQISSDINLKKDLSSNNLALSTHLVIIEKDQDIDYINNFIGWLKKFVAEEKKNHRPILILLNVTFYFLLFNDVKKDYIDELSIFCKNKGINLLFFPNEKMSLNEKIFSSFKKNWLKVLIENCRTKEWLSETFFIQVYKQAMRLSFCKKEYDSVIKDTDENAQVSKILLEKLRLCKITDVILNKFFFFSKINKNISDGLNMSHEELEEQFHNIEYDIVRKVSEKSCNSKISISKVGGTTQTTYEILGPCKYDISTVQIGFMQKPPMPQQQQLLQTGHPVPHPPSPGGSTSGVVASAPQQPNVILNMPMNITSLDKQTTTAAPSNHQTQLIHQQQQQQSSSISQMNQLPLASTTTTTTAAAAATQQNQITHHLHQQQQQQQQQPSLTQPNQVLMQQNMSNNNNNNNNNNNTNSLMMINAQHQQHQQLNFAAGALNLQNNQKILTDSNATTSDHNSSQPNEEEGAAANGNAAGAGAESTDLDSDETAAKFLQANVHLNTQKNNQQDKQSPTRTAPQAPNEVGEVVGATSPIPSLNSNSMYATNNASAVVVASSQSTPIHRFSA
jgi:hypothetical protein